MNFTAEKISERMYRIKDRIGVAMYLINGDRRSLLIDTGYGLKGLKEFVHSLTDLPLTVALTHGHVDHAMGAGEFEQVYMNPADNETFRYHSEKSCRMNVIRIVEPDFSEELTEPYNKEFLPLRDGQTFDLGGLSVEAIEVPGHTPGTMVFIINEERTAVFGDACGPGTLVMEEFSTDISTYRNALLRLKSMEDRYDRVIRFHGTCVSDKSLLDTVIGCCNAVLNHTDERILVPAAAASIFPVKSDIPVFMARKPGDEKGNLAYRLDKVK